MERVPITNPSQSNPRKIHSAIFIENIEEYVVKYGAERVMEALQEAYSKYKMMETTLGRSKEGMKLKIPEIKKALDIVEALEKKHEEDVVLDFLLTDAVWAKAKISQGNKSVHLWLGANIMVEYSFAEAKDLLGKNLDNANQNLREEDLSFLKDQITTMEVNIARVYNQNVKNMQAAQLLKQQKELEEKEKK